MQGQQIPMVGSKTLQYMLIFPNTIAWYLCIAKNTPSQILNLGSASRKPVSLFVSSQVPCSFEDLIIAFTGLKRSWACLKAWSQRQGSLKYIYLAALLDWERFWSGS